MNQSTSDFQHVRTVVGAYFLSPSNNKEQRRRNQGTVSAVRNNTVLQVCTSTALIHNIHNSCTRTRVRVVVIVIQYKTVFRNSFCCKLLSVTGLGLLV
jgi:hypothetical protein